MKIKILENKKKKWAKDLKKRIKILLEKKGHKIVNKNADYTITIGGDGTIFYYLEKIEGTLIAIGSDSSGICQIKKQDWKKITDYFNKKIKIPIYATIIKNKEQLFINDCYIKSPDHRIIKIKINKRIFVGDGLIISSALGSTGYSYSAGGPILDLKLEAFCLTPVAPLRRISPNLVVPNKNLNIKINREATIILDGLKYMKGKELKIIKKYYIYYAQKG